LAHRRHKNGKKLLNRRTRFVSKKALIRGIAIGALISLSITIFSFLGFLRGWENHVFDFMMWWEGEKRSENIFLIEIDSQDYKELFSSVSPLSRKVLARIIDKLSKAKPTAICLDINLRDKTDEDIYFIKALEHLKEMNISVVLSSSIQETIGAESINYTINTDYPYLPPDNVLFGATNFPISEDGVIREVRLVKRMADGSFYPFISLSIATASQKITWPDLQRELDNDSRSRDFVSEVPKSIHNLIGAALKSQRQKIHFIGNKSSFNSLRISSIDKMPDQSFQLDNILSNKILLIGGTFAESKDFYRTAKGTMSGIEIIANSVETLLSSKPIKPVNHLLSLLYELVIVLVLSYMFLRFPFGKATLASSLSIIPLSIIGSQVAFASFARWLDFIPVALAVFLHGEFSLIEHYTNLKKEVVKLKSHLSKRDGEISELRTQLESARQIREIKRKGD
jgi:CHASE2 domain-containing sensor protein